MKAVFCRPLLCAVVVATFLVGCGGSSREFNGVVLRDDAPLQNAGVKLISQTDGKVLYGTTDSEGKFTIVETGGQAVEPGEYLVVVDKVPAEMGGKSEVPKVYRQEETSTLKVTIGSDNTLIPPIELKSKP